MHLLNAPVRDLRLRPLSLLGRFLQFAGKFFDALTHNLAGLKFHRRSRRNDETASGLVWISPYSRFGQPRLKNAEVAQFHWNIIGQAVGDFVQSALNHIEDFVLHHPGLVADRNDNVALGEF
jgi:hypothetical protein